jgi:hypothetical protein
MKGRLIMGKKSTAEIAVPAKSDRDYQAESDFSTLERAEEVRSNSSRFKMARMMGQKKLRATQKVLGRIGKRSMKGKIKIG